MKEVASWRELNSRGKELKKRLDSIINGDKQDSKIDKGKRDSIIRYDSVGCSIFFQHPHAFRTTGLQVAERIHTANVVKSCPEVIIDTLNEMKRRREIMSNSNYIHYTRLSVMRGERRTHGSVSVSGPFPHTNPFDVRHAVIKKRMPRLNLPIRELLDGSITTVPVYLSIHVMRHCRWEIYNSPELTQETRLTKVEYPNIASRLEEGAKRQQRIIEFSQEDDLEIPLFGDYAWMEIGGNKWVMQIDTHYTHAVALVFNHGGNCVMIDSNKERPIYAQTIIQQWVESLGFQLLIAKLPDINQEDSVEIKSILAQLDVDTPVSIGGYCASITMCCLVDILCTGKYDDDHILRFLSDIIPAANSSELTQSTCIVLFARAIASDCIKLCINRLNNTGIPYPDKWPPGLHTYDFETVTVKWKNLLHL